MTSTAPQARQPTRAQRRNSALRQALQDAFPGQRFTVRNGPKGSAAVTWTDGPTATTVGEVVRSVPSDRPPAPWTVELTRAHSRELIAAAYLKARAAGGKYYSERDRAGHDIEAGDVRPALEVLSSWTLLAQHLDPGDVTPSEWAQARLAVAMAGRVPGGDDAARVLARIVFHYGDTITEALARAS